MSETTMSDEQRQAFLAGLGLRPNAPTLEEPAKPASHTPRPAGTPKLAPKGVDPHTMPVADIVFDPALLDGFPSLEGEGFAAASRHVFAFYKSPGRNKDRHSLLHRRIGEFINQVRRARETGTGHVREKVKTTKTQRDLAAFLAEHDVSEADLAALIRQKGADA